MAVSHFLDPKNDFIFKKTFGEEKNKDILISFLNDILGYAEGYKIKEVTFLPNTYNPKISVLRQSIIDVLCTDQHGRQFVVEMQLTKHKGFEKRAMLYACQAYSRQRMEEDENHKKMEVYAKLKGVVFLAIANFVMFPEKDAWKSEHHILDKETYENDLEDLKFVFIELPKFKKSLEELENIHSLLYQTRNIIERVFGRIKEFRRVATRYDKLDSTFLSFIACAFIWQLLC